MREVESGGAVNGIDPSAVGTPMPRRGALATRHQIDFIMLVAGATQLVGLLTPAVRVRLYGVIPFLRLPNAGVVLAGLGVATLLLSLVRGGRWRMLPGVLTTTVLVVAHWRIVHSPSGMFVDPIVRRLARPAWGLYPMSVAAVLAIVAGGIPRRSVPPSPRE